jgi:hypothetical protein
MLLGVAVIAMFCGYHTDWIRQRHQMLNVYKERFAAFDKMKAERGTANNLNIYLVNINRPAPHNLLWLFGEKNLLDSVLSLPIHLTEDDPPTTEQSEIELAKSLFPEAKQLIVECYRWGPKTK